MPNYYDEYEDFSNDEFLEEYNELIQEGYEYAESALQAREGWFYDDKPKKLEDILIKNLRIS